MGKKIVVDPITRIEGHLRIEAKVEDGVVVDAWSSGTQFRGIEKILEGRDPRDAWYITQRFCGVCTTVHSIASVRAVEDALDIAVPLNAEMLRNIIMGIQNVQDHIIHFYHLSALDWVDIVSALSADPAKTAQLQQSISNWKYSSATYFKGVQERVASFVKTGRLGPFSNAYWGHSAYKLPPEANLMAVSHYLQALDVQKEIIKIHAILGSKNPHPQCFLVGGVSTPIDPNSQNAINADTIARIKEYIKMAQEFVEQVYIPDVLAVAPFYLDWAGIGGGHANYMSYGDFHEGNTPYKSGKPDGLWIPKGIVQVKDGQILTKDVDEAKISEDVSHSWYVGNEALHPYDGKTDKNYTGPKPPYDFLNTGENDKYSFVKSPRYDGEAMEVGPLARMVVAYVNNHEEIKPIIDSVLAKLNAPVTALFSTLGRTAARAIETLVVVKRLDKWVAALAENIASGDLRNHDGRKWDPKTWPKHAKGFGWHEAPRGALGHWIVIEDGQIKNYQAVVPSTWNAGPRDGQGTRGQYEQSLIGTPIADPEKPLEIVRTIHSFDPCLSCAVHVYDGDEKLKSKVKIL